VSVDLQSFDPGTIADESTREVVVAALNRCEELTDRLTSALAEIQRLTAEIYRLKGEHPPRPRGGGGAAGAKPPRNHSSEGERQEPRPRQKSSKRDVVAVDRREALRVNRTGLPADLEAKGVVRVVIQDLVVRRENVEFLREKFYSPSTGQTYLAPLPPGYRGAFGPGLRTLTLELGYGANVTFPKIHGFLTQRGILISRGKVASLLTQELTELHAEAAAVVDAGLASSPWQQLDVTSTPVGTEWQACHLLSNPLYTAFRTTPRQDREAILATLWGSRAPRYRLDAGVLARLEAQGVGPQVRCQLAALVTDGDWEEAAFSATLQAHLPRLGRETREAVREAAGIAAYHAATDGPVVRCLHGDDAATFRELTAELSLCWVHDARHYQKLQPQYAAFCAEVEAFQARYWEFYRQLKAYRAAPAALERAPAAALEAAFDALCATEVYYQPLAQCIARTRANKQKLLLVLAHPELPLHNNEAEFAARRRVIKRRVSHGPKSTAGAKAWDTLQTLAATTAKLGISFAQYLADRLGRGGAIPPLAEVIRVRAAQLNLGGSWAEG
jgi:hypothetical protein